jgi:hypothetical protein
MLELPVRQEQEDASPPSAPIPYPDRIRLARDVSATDWESSKDVEIDNASARAQSPSTYPSKRFLRADPLEIAEKPPLELDRAWESAEPSGSAHSLLASDQENHIAPEPELVPDSAAENWQVDNPSQEPGFIRILLGWAGLVFLVVSLTILLLEWYGWTW